jgi:hypothetical protein
MSAEDEAVYRLAFSRLVSRRAAIIGRGLTDDELGQLQREFEMLPEQVILGLAVESSGQLAAVVDEQPRGPTRYTIYKLVFSFAVSIGVPGFMAYSFAAVDDSVGAAGWTVTGIVVTLAVAWHSGWFRTLFAQRRRGRNKSLKGQIKRISDDGENFDG